MKRAFGNLGIVLLSLALFLLVFEGVLAIFHPSKLKHRPYHERYDATMGWVNKPLKDDDVHFEYAPSRFFHVTHNSKGLRGPEADYERPVGRKRVLFVGDSFFWGYGVNDDEVLTAVFQKDVGRAVEVLNGGVTGYGTDQELLWLQNEGMRYRPDVVVLGVTLANDLEEISSSVSYFFPKPIFRYEAGELVLRNVPVPRTPESDRTYFAEPPTAFGRLKKFLRYHTHTYNFVMRRINSRPDWRVLLINLGLAEDYRDRLDGIPVFENDPNDRITVWMGLLRKMKQECDRAGAKLLLVVIPEKERDPSGTVAYEGVRDGAGEQNTRLSRELSERMRKENIHVLDLLPLMRRQAAAGTVLYHKDRYDHHWTAEGHRFAAARIRERLHAEGWIR